MEKKLHEKKLSELDYQTGSYGNDMIKPFYEHVAKIQKQWAIAVVKEYERMREEEFKHETDDEYVCLKCGKGTGNNIWKCTHGCEGELEDIVPADDLDVLIDFLTKHFEITEDELK